MFLNNRQIKFKNKTLLNKYIWLERKNNKA